MEACANYETIVIGVILIICGITFFLSGAPLLMGMAVVFCFLGISLIADNLENDEVDMNLVLEEKVLLEAISSNDYLIEDDEIYIYKEKTSDNKFAIKQIKKDNHIQIQKSTIDEDEEPYLELYSNQHEKLYIFYIPVVA